MLDKVVSGSIALAIVVLVFAWASITTELQLQAAEFMNAVYAFQVLAEFDEGAFTRGDANYVLLTLNRGRIDVWKRNYTVHISVLVEGVEQTSLEYRLTTAIPSYRGGWLVSTPEAWYRGSSDAVTSSSVVLVVYAEVKDGPRVFISPRIRVADLGLVEGVERVMLVNVYIPVLEVGESGGSNPYRVYLETSEIEVETVEVDVDGREAWVSVEVNGNVLETARRECDKLLLTVITSRILFGVRGV